jgi:hypothetical protein
VAQPTDLRQRQAICDDLQRAMLEYIEELRTPGNAEAQDERMLKVGVAARLQQMLTEHDR